MKKIILFLSSIFLIGCGGFTLLVEEGANVQYKTSDDGEFKSVEIADDTVDVEYIAKCMEFGLGILGLGADKVTIKIGTEEQKLSSKNWLVKAGATKAEEATEKCSEDNEKVNIITVKVEQDGVTINGEEANNGECVKVTKDAEIKIAAVEAQGPPSSVVAKDAVEVTHTAGNWLVKDHKVSEANSACE